MPVSEVDDTPRIRKARARIPLVARLGLAMMATAVLLIVLDVPARISGDPKDPSFNVVAANAATLPDTAAPADAVQVQAPKAAPGLKAVLASTEQVWGNIFKQSGLTYQAPVLAAQGAVDSGACAESENSGPAMYCAENGTIYVDPAAPATTALGFAIAHEVGHHIQALFGIGLGAEADSSDLQADCYAGVWAANAGGISPEQLARSVDGMVGARIASFAVGYNGGSPMACQDMLSAQL